MKKQIKSIILIVIITLIYLPLNAEDAQNLGKPLTRSDVTKISQILATPDEYVGKRVLVQGMVVDVCAKRGCWMDIASDKAFEQIQIKVLDGEIVFPMSARGKDALVEGIVEALEYSKEEAIEWLDHKAEEKGEAFDPKSVTGPLTIYRIQGLGAKIME